MQWWLLLGLAGCGETWVDLTIDLGHLQDEVGVGIFEADVLRDSEVVHEIRLSLPDNPTITVPAGLEAGAIYGFIAWLDMDEDGACAPPPVDLTWIFYYQPGFGNDYVWRPDPTESPSMSEACAYYGGDDGLGLPDEEP